MYSISSFVSYQRIVIKKLCEFKSLCFSHQHNNKEQNQRESIIERDSDNTSNRTKSQQHQWNKVSQSRHGNPKDEDLLKEW